MTQECPADPVAKPFRSVREALVWSAVVAAIGWNVWLAWSSRSLPDDREIGRWIAGGRTEAAEVAFRQRLERSPNDGAARFGLASLLENRGDGEAAADQFGRVPIWDERKAEALFREGKLHRTEGRFSSAARAWGTLLDDRTIAPRPGFAVAGAAIGLTEIRTTQRRADLAIDALGRLYDEVAPQERERVLGLMVEAQTSSLDPSTALGRLRAAVGADPMDADSADALDAWARPVERSSEEEELAREFEAWRAGSVAESDWGARLERLAAICRSLGWGREAELWLDLGK